jgi:hypothetical protein
MVDHCRVGNDCRVCLILTGRPTVGSAGEVSVWFARNRIILILLSTIYPQVVGPWQASALFTLAVAAEVSGRWQLYAGRTPFLMDNN